MRDLHPSLVYLLPLISAAVLLVVGVTNARAQDERPKTSIHWQNDLLTIRNPRLAGEIEVHYLEAFCRPGSTNRDWSETVIAHRTDLQSAAPQHVRLRSTLADGVVVDHTIHARPDEVDFRLTAHNPTNRRSEAHWAQPCIRVDRFTGVKRVPASEAYLPKCFLFLDGAMARLPTPHWATTARYTPGQVWCPAGVPRTDVNPRPLNPDLPSNGLIGCYSGDESQILATAWEPYQELFQGVITCLHADFRLGGLKPGERRQIRGKIYLVDADVPGLLQRYAKDFPEHRPPPPPRNPPRGR